MDIDSVLKGHGIGIGGSNIKSRQSGRCGLYDYGLFDIDINAVNMDKSIITTNIEYRGYGYNQNALMGEFVSSSKIRLASGYTAAAFTCPNTYWEVIEFNNVKSKQYGEVTLTKGINAISTSATVTVNAVDSSKSMLFYSFKATGDNSGKPMIVSSTIDSNTTLGCKFENNGGTSAAVTVTLYWQLIEFN